MYIFLLLFCNITVLRLKHSISSFVLLIKKFTIQRYSDFHNQVKTVWLKNVSVSSLSMHTLILTTNRIVTDRYLFSTAFLHFVLTFMLLELFSFLFINSWTCTVFSLYFEWKWKSKTLVSKDFV